MRYKHLLIFLIVFSSCEKSIDRNRGNSQEQNLVTENIVTNSKTKLEQEVADCDKYWKIRFPGDSIRGTYIDKIISNQKLTENNRIFLKSLKENNQDEFAFKKVLAPIFRLSNKEIGILAFPKYKQVNNKLVSISKEMDLIENFDTITENTMEHFGEIKFYPKLLNSVFKDASEPELYFYTTSRKDSTRIKELGIYVDECLEYYEYSIDTTNISLNDKVLFSSPYKIDLVYKSDFTADSLIKAQFRKECYDCPNSLDSLKTFARVKGTNNLFFAYADTFPINNKLDTPSRALILINEKDEIIYLWYEEIDLFGCSCL